MKIRIKNYPVWHGSYKTISRLFEFILRKEFDAFPSWAEKICEKYSDSWIGNLHDSFATWYINFQEKRRVKVKIEPFDTWSMDSTLGYIIIPMLKQLKETKQGSPMVDDDDVPEIFRSTQDKEYDPNNKDGDLDKFFFRRWDWVMDEMIWAFEAARDDYALQVPTEAYKDVQNRIQNGYRLFGKYYSGLWD